MSHVRAEPVPGPSACSRSRGCHFAPKRCRGLATGPTCSPERLLRARDLPDHVGLSNRTRATTTQAAAVLGLVLPFAFARVRPLPTPHMLLPTVAQVYAYLTIGTAMAVLLGLPTLCIRRTHAGRGPCQAHDHRAGVRACRPAARHTGEMAFIVAWPTPCHGRRHFVAVGPWLLGGPGPCAQGDLRSHCARSGRCLRTADLGEPTPRDVGRADGPA